MILVATLTTRKKMKAAGAAMSSGMETKEPGPDEVERRQQPEGQGP